MQNKNKGFTLTKLLVVVVLIGVLGTIIVPKFNKVFLARQFTEAENMLTAIRQEQVMRCMDPDWGWYTREPWELSSLNSLRETNFASKYFRYSLYWDGMADAINLQNSNLVLRVLSYEDGRICCSDKNQKQRDACNSLNKDYPLCEDLKSSPDFVPPLDQCL